MSDVRAVSLARDATRLAAAEWNRLARKVAYGTSDLKPPQILAAVAVSSAVSLYLGPEYAARCTAGVA